MSEIEIKSKEIKLVPIEQIIEHPKNANRHSVEQIERLCKLIRFQGFRSPLIISNRSGFLVSGHGRKMAAEKLGMEKLPCVYQDFKDEATEYAYVVSENEIARWAELDKEAVHTELETLDVDIDLLGIEEFKVEEIDLPELSDEDRGELRQMAFQLTEEQVAEVERAIKISKAMGQFDDTGSSNSNGNALQRMAQIFTTQNGSADEC